MGSALEGVGLRDIWRWPLPSQSHSRRNRILIRLMYSLLHRQLAAVEGLEQVSGRSGPFILVANHGSRREALMLPALLYLVRGGRPVHFLADWNFRLIPGIDLLYRASGAITVTGKSARPRFLNLFRPLFEHSLPPLERARRCLRSGHAVGIFPEGTVNRSPHRLLLGRSGAARLSLQTGVPVIPAGIRFAGVTAKGLVDSASPLSIRFGAPIYPRPNACSAAPPLRVRDWHARLMEALAEVSGKSWPGNSDGTSGAGITGKDLPAGVDHA